MCTRSSFMLFAGNTPEGQLKQHSYNFGSLATIFLIGSRQDQPLKYDLGSAFLLSPGRPVSQLMRSISPATTLSLLAEASRCLQRPNLPRVSRSQNEIRARRSLVLCLSSACNFKKAWHPVGDGVQSAKWQPALPDDLMRC